MALLPLHRKPFLLPPPSPANTQTPGSGDSYKPPKCCAKDPASFPPRGSHQVPQQCLGIRTSIERRLARNVALAGRGFHRLPRRCFWVTAIYLSPDTSWCQLNQIRTLRTAVTWSSIYLQQITRPPAIFQNHNFQSQGTLQLGAGNRDAGGEVSMHAGSSCPGTAGSGTPTLWT